LMNGRLLSSRSPISLAGHSKKTWMGR
jgi:hypothetical protein